MLLTAAGLAEVCQVNRSTVHSWAMEGCPHIRKPTRGRPCLQFDLGDVLVWRLIRQGSLEAAVEVLEGQRDLLRERLVEKGIEP